MRECIAVLVSKFEKFIEYSMISLYESFFVKKYHILVYRCYVVVFITSKLPYQHPVTNQSYLGNSFGQVEGVAIKQSNHDVPKLCQCLKD